jgi:hypothetical protein
MPSQEDVYKMILAKINASPRGYLHAQIEMDSFMHPNRESEQNSYNGVGASHSDLDGNQKLLIDMRAIKV